MPHGSLSSFPGIQRDRRQSGAYGKPTQFVAAENDEPALNDLNLEELRASMLADFERVFPEYRLVPAEQLKVIPGPEETVCDTAESTFEENLG